ncbi:MAG: LysR substrate binding domain-containing protein [Glomeribacter sp. 1016415]|nr:LysR substrate binding domain-containing protein [Glomeribacter sp. 1016415]
MCGDGQGGTLLPSFAARHEIKAGQLIALEIDHPAFNSVESCLTVRQGRPLPPAVNQLLRLIVAKSSIFSRGVA